jgi:predicted amidohydrolase
LVVFPELTLTTFFPRWYTEDQAEIDQWFETEMPGPETQALFDAAAKLQIGFHLGYAELVEEAGQVRRFNTAILVDKNAQIIGKYRKIHLPGHVEDEPWRAFQHLEKRYFETGNLGFRVFDGFGGKVGMCICNDRRWPETYRVMGLQGAELIVLGYNTPVHNPPAPEHDALGLFHNQIVMQSAAYQNGTWIVGVAKAGNEEGVPMIAGTQIIAPSGETVAMAAGEGDELITAACDLDLAASYKSTVFNFALHREPQHYGLITATKGAVSPADGVALEKSDK